ncbi:MAG: hypothetical protein IT430_16785 [Phycisphaerales bacterium]|nr:hypothetical protein [Phycisphaerales bacterium]
MYGDDRWQYHICGSLLAALILVWGLCSVARAQSDDTSNAAVWYQRAWEQQWNLSKDEILAVELYRKQAGQPSAEVREIMRKAAPMLADIRRATNIAYAEFDVLPGVPEGGRVVQVGKLRGLVPWIDADTKIRIADGDGAGAASQMAAMYRIVAHAGDGRSPMSALYSAALGNFLESTLDYATEGQSLGAGDLAVVLSAMDALNPHDPFQFVDGFASEQAYVDQLLDAARQPGSALQVSKVLQEIGYEPEHVPGLADLNEGEQWAEIAAYRDLLGTFTTIEDSDDPQCAAEQVRLLQDAAGSGELGPLVTAALEALIGFHETNTRIKAALAARRLQLAGLVQGEIEPVELANAAVYYRRGIEHLNSVSVPWPDMLARIEAGGSAAAGELTQEQWEEIQTIIEKAMEQFHAGSLIRRCDFSTRRLQEEVFLPDYAGGMRLGLAVCGARVHGLLESGRYDDAAAHLATSFRIIGHLGGDGVVLSAMEAHDAYQRGLGLVREVLSAASTAGDDAAQSIEAARLAELAAAIRRTRPHDPFGYRAADQLMSEKSASWIRAETSLALQRWKPDAAAGEHKAMDERALRWIASLTPAQRWYAFGAMSLNSDWDEHLVDRIQERADSYSRRGIASIVSMAASDSSKIRAACRTGEFKALELPDVEYWLNLSGRVRDAATDQRAGDRLAEALVEVASVEP